MEDKKKLSQVLLLLEDDEVELLDNIKGQLKAGSRSRAISILLQSVKVVQPYKARVKVKAPSETVVMT